MICYVIKELICLLIIRFDDICMIISDDDVLEKNVLSVYNFMIGILVQYSIYEHLFYHLLYIYASIIQLLITILFVLA